MQPITFQQFCVLKGIFGLYLTIHFLGILPNAVELFSNQGMVRDARLLPAYGKLPLPLFYFDDPTAVIALILVCVVASVALTTVGRAQRPAAAVLFVGK